MLKRLIEERLAPATMVLCFLVMFGNIVAGMIIAREASPPAALPSHGAALPNVTLSLLEDSSRGVNAASLLGRNVLLTFWNTDCAQCTDSLRAAAAIERQHAATGLVVLAVNTDLPATYLSAREQGRLLSPELVPVHDAGGMLYRYWGRPRWVLLDRDGRVAASGRTTAPSVAELAALVAA